MMKKGLVARPEKGTKMVKTWISKSVKKMMPLGIGSGKDFGRFLEATCDQIGMTIGSKMNVKIDKSFFRNTL